MAAPYFMADTRLDASRVVWRSTHHVRAFPAQGLAMLWTIAVILVVLWVLGLVTSSAIGGFIHILLVLAIVAVLIRVLQGRKPV